MGKRKEDFDDIQSCDAQRTQRQRVSASRATSFYPSTTTTHESRRPMPRLNPGPSLPRPYLNWSNRHTGKTVVLKDPEVEEVQNLATTASIASTLSPPPELSKADGAVPYQG